MRKDEPALKNPNQIAAEVAEVYYIEKDAAIELKDLRADFFLAASLEAQGQTLARKTVAVPDTIEPEDSKAYVEQYNAGWRILEQDKKGRFVIEEDPDFIGYVSVIPVGNGVADSKGKVHPGYVVTKTIRSGTTMFDEERLAQDDEELWEEVMTFRNWDRMVEIGKGFGLNVHEVRDWLIQIEWQRELKPESEIDPGNVPLIQVYFYEGPKTIALNVRYAKDEDL